ncbi:type II toxin-antitoxin system prevent-host-death family antitoxin [Iodobacter sp. CM08]|uniref:type II toxin-antitoxin system Phd/YefM family antitoxin n=1 Tax=Iodobacter sp. CM08 TaxID=3085902 RepID=UPI0029814DCC|nr:type II toxin-antitoxin system prevent-host-death family antitoxin [Iodobacter sp. CM08]MDW5417454.1 type II toxin-antitoxin system prevent-host-death family antitoxin [Iodobacter sp. CM08]
MLTINMHEAKTNLSKLVDQAKMSGGFIIAKAGKPLVKVTPLDAPPTMQRLGFMSGQFLVPDDFDTMAAKEIELLFGGADE